MKTDSKKSHTTNLCACCEEVPHNGIPDRELNGYVCSECAQLLKKSETALIKAGMSKPKMGGL